MNVIWLERPVCVEQVAVGTVESLWGAMFSAWHGDGLTRLGFVDGEAGVDDEMGRIRRAWECEPAWLDASDPRLQNLDALLKQWPRIDGPSRPTLEMNGSVLQHNVWRTLLRLRMGETMTYGDIAQRLGTSRTARAVGRAVGANPVSVLVPCHRVLPAAGGAGHYAGGAERKKALLYTEGVIA